MSFDFDGELKAISNVAATAERNVKGLLTFDGRPIVAPEEYEPKRQAYLQPLRETVQRVYEMADRAEAEADVIASVAHVDPLSTVDTDTLRRMTLLADFVREDVADLGVYGLANRLRGVLHHGDHAAKRLYLREAVKLSGKPDYIKILPILEAIEESLESPEWRKAKDKALQGAKDLRARAVEVRTVASDTLGRIDGSKATAWEKRRQEYQM